MLRVFAIVMIVAVLAARMVKKERRLDDAILVATLAWVPGFVLDIDAVYVVVDAALGGRNYVNLVVHCCLIVGLWSFYLATREAMESAMPRRGGLYLGVAIALEVVLFLIGSPQGSAADFVETFGGNPVLAVYTAVLFLFIAWVALSAVVVNAAQIFSGQIVVLRWCGSVLGFGWLIIALSALSQVLSAAARVFGWMSLAEAAGDFYDFTQALGILVASAGFLLLEGAKNLLLRRQDSDFAFLTSVSTKLDLEVDSGLSVSEEIYNHIVELGDVLPQDLAQVLKPQEIERIARIGRDYANGHY